MTPGAANAVVAAAPEDVKAGPLALLIILLLVVACYFLFRSMSRHLRRVPEDFPTDPGAPRSDPERTDPPG